MIKGLVFGPGSVFSLVTDSDKLETFKGRTNVLVLGIGGEGHSGADLTDTLIFFSIKKETNNVLMLSIPRDLWVPSLRAKINTAYHYGEEKELGKGLVLAKAAVAEVLGVPVHYATVVDFTGFVKAVDLLGGVDIEVERSFDDFKYPIPGKEDAQPESERYEHLHFGAGWQRMDGATALKYSRSRYAEGEEGTDFARSRRQQRLVKALFDKILSTQTLLDLGKVSQLLEILGQSVKTEVKPEDYPYFLKMAIKVKKENLRSVVLDGWQEEDGLLVNPPKTKDYDYQWVLVPRDGDWAKIHEWVERLLE